MEQSKRDKLTVETVTIEEDISFMKSMMSNREAHYSGCDKVTSSIINRRQFKSMQDLSLFVGEDSWSIFSVMKLNYGFLSKPVEYWPKDAGYLEAKLIINNLSVVNDGAERGVKLAYDFIGSSKKEDNFQNILQTVENDRRLIPNQRKRKLTSKGWSLKLD